MFLSVVRVASIVQNVERCLLLSVTEAADLTSDTRTHTVGRQCRLTKMTANIVGRQCRLTMLARVSRALSLQLFCCRRRNVKTSCHKHFVVVSSHQQAPPLTTNENVTTFHGPAAPC